MANKPLNLAGKAVRSASMTLGEKIIWGKSPDFKFEFWKSDPLGHLSEMSMTNSSIFFFGYLIVSLVLVWFFQRKSYYQLKEEGYQPVQPISRTDSARFLGVCIEVLINKECAEKKPSNKLRVFICLLILSYLLFAILLVFAAVK